ncbi:MAG TPA: hypothetical protein PLU83_14980 [Phycicoccus sp.]|jgi:hypothetical protein|nr:hypothetical protein [Phycicoccus sp.]
MSEQEHIVGRRSLARGAAWAIPVIAVGGAAPTFAGSGDVCPPVAFGSVNRWAPDYISYAYYKGAPYGSGAECMGDIVSGARDGMGYTFSLPEGHPDVAVTGTITVTARPSVGWDLEQRPNDFRIDESQPLLSKWENPEITNSIYLPSIQVTWLSASTASFQVLVPSGGLVGFMLKLTGRTYSWVNTPDNSLDNSACQFGVPDRNQNGGGLPSPIDHTSLHATMTAVNAHFLDDQNEIVSVECTPPSLTYYANNESGEIPV